MKKIMRVKNNSIKKRYFSEFEDPTKTIKSISKGLFFVSIVSASCYGFYKYTKYREDKIAHSHVLRYKMLQCKKDLSFDEKMFDFFVDHFKQFHGEQLIGMDDETIIEMFRYFVDQQFRDIKGKYRTLIKNDDQSKKQKIIEMYDIANVRNKIIQKYRV